MPELTIQNIELISKEIARHEITFSHLSDELIDHVCCDIEEEMQSGLTFSDAFNKVFFKIGPDRFSQIQKDTLYAVDLKYRNMRNLMKFSGITGTILFGTAALFKIQHWPLSGILMTIGGIILAFLFLPSSLSVLWKETHSRKKIFLFVSGFIAGAFLITGALFKAQHWPGAGVLLTTSFLSCIFMFIPALLQNLLQDTEKTRFRAVFITAFIGAVLYILGFLFKIQHWPYATILILLGTVIIGFIAIPWYTRLEWNDSSSVHPEFIFLLVACLIIIVPGILITLNYQNSNQKEGTSSPQPLKQDYKNIYEIK
ncbi:MAG TPA: hypothetical protein VK213_14590 [Bacteroidales bacterium]|nr:hypothetical protein [Bacteroidales bacterium]